MAYRTFQYLLPCDGEHEDLNQFLQDNRIASVRQEIVQSGGRALLVFVVETISGGATAAARPSGGGKGKGPDYSRILAREEYLVYSRLREARKDWARAEGGPIYNIFGNEELAAMVMNRVRTAADLAKIPGVGEMRIRKYGTEILKIISELPVKSDPAEDGHKAPPTQ